MSDEPRAGLEEPLLEARQGPALDNDGQEVVIDERTWKVVPEETARLRAAAQSAR